MKLGQIIVFLFLPITIPKTESFPQKQGLKVRYAWDGHQRQKIKAVCLTASEQASAV